MNLIEAFNAFDSWTRLNTLSANQRSLYIAILQLWNAAGRPEYSSIPEQKLTELSGLSKKTFYNVRNQLEEFGLIGVVKSKSKNIAPKYTLKDISVKNDDNFTPISTPKVTPILTPKVTPNLAPYTEKRIEEDRREEEASSANSDFQKLIELYQTNFGIVKPILYEDLKADLKDYGIELIVEAVKRAVKRQKEYAYAQSILKSWDKKGIKTLTQAKGEEVSFNNKSQNNQKNFQQQKPVKSPPAWTDEGRLIKAGVDTTGMSQNEMYAKAEEMGLHDGSS